MTPQGIFTSTALAEMFDLERIWWVVLPCILTTVVGIVVAQIHNSIEKQRDERRDERRAVETHDRTMDAAMRYLLKDRILQACQHWQDVGYCPVHNKEVLTDMVDIYHTLGGNSFVTEVYDAVMELPYERRAGRAERA